MIRSQFFASLPGFALLTKLWPGLKVEPKVWHSEGSGPLHFLLLRRKAKLESSGGDPKFFQCNSATVRMLVKEFGWCGPADPRFDNYWTSPDKIDCALVIGNDVSIQVEGLTWVDKPKMDDGCLWVHSYRCPRCCDTGQIGNMQMAGNRVYGLIPDPVPLARGPCPRCRPWYSRYAEKYWKDREGR